MVFLKHERRVQLLEDALEQAAIGTAFVAASTDNGNTDDLSTDRLLEKFNVLIGKDSLTSTTILLLLRSSTIP